MSQFQDLTGRIFGKWKVLSHISGSRPTKFLCECECGTVRPVLSGSLIGGVSQSCGCRQDKVARDNFKKHGRSATPEYKRWQEMRRRCDDPNRKCWANYGGRGIKVCPVWNDPTTGFTAFLRDMGSPPSPHHQIDRIDNDGGYCPENCRWVLCQENSRNRRSNRLLTLNGESLLMTDWAARLGVKSATIHNRLARGWSVEKAISQKPSKSS